MLADFDLHNRVSELRTELSTQLDDMVQACAVSDYIALMGDPHRPGKYQNRSLGLVQAFEKLKLDHSPQIAKYHAVVLLTLITQSLEKIGELNLTTEIVDLCVNNFERIFETVESADIDYMDSFNDRFDKDLATASLKLICAGAQKLHKIHFPLYLVKRHPILWTACTVKIGWRGILYEMHTDSNDPLLMADFNKDGWIRFYSRTAKLLENNDVGGVIGTTWFFDPALAEVSPRLAYLRELIMDNGGISIKMGTSSSDIESATRTSPTRRSLYQNGEYTPVAYTLVWPRDQLIEWASNS